MKPQLWTFIILIVFGAAFAAFWSGHYEGVRTTSNDANKFLREFARSTQVDSYLQQRSQQEWSGKLLIYGIGGPTSYLHAQHNAAIALGMVVLAVGLGGVLFSSKKAAL